MRSSVLLFVVLLVPVVHAQELLEQQRWPDGTLKYTAYSEGGRLHFISYHETGRVKEMGGYRDGKLDGVWKQFTDTGSLLTHATFKNGLRQGEWEFRTAEDVPLGTLSFVDGALARGELYNELGDVVASRDYP